MIQRTKPNWLKIKLPSGEKARMVQNIISEEQLHTICSSGNCPNRGECWNNGTATFMIAGDVCTRACKFCNVKTGRPEALDLEEAEKIAKSIHLLHLKHAVITSVTRDDLPDQGANHWAKVIRRTKEMNPQTSLEVLIPDFGGDKELINRIIEEKPEVISHNLETIKRLTPSIRSKATYANSLNVIRHIAESGLVAKSGIMLGLGESEEEVIECMRDLRDTGCKVITIGQYLQPSLRNLPVFEFISPEMYKVYEEKALSMGFSHAECGAFVRSSYHAEKHVHCHA